MELLKSIIVYRRVIGLDFLFSYIGCCLKNGLACGTGKYRRGGSGEKIVLVVWVGDEWGWVRKVKEKIKIS